MVPDRVTSMDSGLKLSVKTFEMNPDDGEEWRRIPTPEGVELALSLWFGALGRTIGTLTCFEGPGKGSPQVDLMSTGGHPGVVGSRRHRR